MAEEFKYPSDYLDDESPEDDSFEEKKVSIEEQNERIIRLLERLTQINRSSEDQLIEIRKTLRFFFWVFIVGLILTIMIGF